MVNEITSGEFSEYLKSDLVFIDFFAEWCMPCMMMSPVIDDLSEEFKEKVKMGKINIEDYPEIADKYEVTSIPTFVIFKEGKPVEKISGSMTQDELTESLNKYI